MTPHAVQIDARDARTAVLVTPAAYTDMTAWHETVAELRAEAPIHRVELEGWTPFWAVLSHAEVTEVSRRSDVFWNTERSAPAPDAQYDLLAALGLELPKTLVHLHGEAHAKYRAVTSDWFKPAAVKKLQPAVDSIAEEYAQRLVDFGGCCDFAQDIAVPFTTHVIMTIFGVPASDERLMLELTQGLFGAGDPEYLGDATDPVELVGRTIQKFSDYFDELTAKRRAHPTDDLATVIANGQVDGEPLGDAERLWYYIIVATAGHDTTSYALSGGMEALLGHRAQLDALAGDPGLLHNAAEEILRWTSPVRSFFRWAHEDVELRNGAVIPAGDVVLTSYPSANRDEAVFDDSMAFDIYRPNADRLLSFGMGVHHCLGAQVGRRELRALLAKVLDRTASIELDGAPEWVSSHFVGGVKHLPISYTLR